MAARLDRNVVVLGTASLLNDIASEMIFPLLPAFLTSVLGAAPAFLGLVEGAADSMSSLLRPLFGAVSDRMARRKPLVVGGYAIAGVVRPLIAVATAPWQVLMMRVCDRVGKGVRTAPRDALLAEVSDPLDRGRAFGFHRAMDHAGAVLGPLAAAALFAVLGRSYRWLFALASIPGLAAVLFTALRVSERNAAASAPVQNEAARAASLAVFRDRSFAGLIAAVFLFGLGNSSDAFLLLRLEQVGVDVALLPFLWAGLHLVKAASVYPCGILSDRLGRRPLIFAGWAYYALLYGGFAAAGSPRGAAALFLAYGLFYGLTEGAERALVGDLVAAEHRGAAFGIYDAAVGISALPASVVMGVIWQRFDPAAAFLLGAAMAGLAAAALLVATRGPGATGSRSTPCASETATARRA